MSSSWLSRVIILPSAVFLSVVFGGSYGTGREIMEFVSQFGPKGGLLGVCAIYLSYTVLLGLTFELTRLFREYEYRGFIKLLLGKLWFLYEIVILIGMILTLAICTTAAGTVLNHHFSLPVWVGGLLMLAIVFGLTYQGRTFVESSMKVSVAALMLILVGLLIQLWAEGVDVIKTNFANDTANAGAWAGGLQYALVNGGFIPLLLYCARGLETRAQSACAALCAAGVAVIPALVFHFAFMRYYPEITSKELPTYWLLEQIAAPWFLSAYALVLVVLIAQTGVGMLQGFIDRIDAWWQQSKGESLSSLGHGGIGAGMVAASMGLSTLGIITLILMGYQILAVSFIVIFAIPLVTRGLWLVLKRGR